MMYSIVRYCKGLYFYFKEKGEFLEILSKDMYDYFDCYVYGKNGRGKIS